MNFDNNVYLDVILNRYTVVNGPFCFKVLNRNIDRVIKNYELLIIPDSNMNIKSFCINLSNNEFINYSVFYSLDSDKDKFIPFFSNINNNINLTDLNIVNDRIYCFKITAPFFNLSNDNTLFLFRGDVLNNSFVYVYLKENNNIIKRKKAYVYISNIFFMNLKLESFPKILNSNLDYFYYKLSISSKNGILKNPIVGILLPFNLEKYYINEEKYEIVDLVNNTSLFNVDNEFNNNYLPIPYIINNFDNTSRVLVKYTFKDYILPPDYVFNIYVKVKVNFNSDIIAHAYSFNDNLCYDSYFNKLC